MNAPFELDEAECRAREVEAFRSEFLRYAAMDDLRQPCPIGRLVGSDMPGMAPKRRQTIAEVIGEEMDYGDNLTRAVELICKMAQGYYRTNEAGEFLRDLANGWADKRSDL